MKIDKDFAVKVEGKVFTANEINKIVIDGGKFNMVCDYTNGSKFEISAYTKDVELYNSAINLDINISTKEMKNAVKEAIESMGKDNKTFTVIPCNEPQPCRTEICDRIKSSANEIMEWITYYNECEKLHQNLMDIGIINKEPDPNTATEISKKQAEEMRRAEYMNRRFMPCFKNENMEPTAQVEVFKKAFNESIKEISDSMKAAGESINQGLKAFNESIKVDLSVNSEQLQKMIKAYGKAITRSGG